MYAGRVSKQVGTSVGGDAEMDRGRRNEPGVGESMGDGRRESGVAGVVKPEEGGETTGGEGQRKGSVGAVGRAEKQEEGEDEACGAEMEGVDITGASAHRQGEWLPGRLFISPRNANVKHAVASMGSQSHWSDAEAGKV